MRKYFLIISILYCYTSSCQVDSIYARIEITSVSLEEHRTWIDTSIIVSLEKLGHSEIISLGKIDSLEIGLQLESSDPARGIHCCQVPDRGWYSTESHADQTVDPRALLGPQHGTVA